MFPFFRDLGRPPRTPTGAFMNGFDELENAIERLAGAVSLLEGAAAAARHQRDADETALRAEIEHASERALRSDALVDEMGRRLDGVIAQLERPVGG